MNMQQSKSKLKYFLATFVLIYCSACHSDKSATIAAAPTAAGAPNNILVIGNSLALHTPYAAIGWTGNWGMAATSADKDYAHVVQSRLEEIHHKPVQLTVRNKAKYERSFWLPDENALAQDLKEDLKIADITIVQLGDNVSESDFSTYDFPKQYEQLILSLKNEGKSGSKILCVGTWWGNAKKEAAIKEACSKISNGTYVAISNIGQKTQFKASATRSFQNKGVGEHPSDEGMKAIAENITNALSPSPSTR